MDIYLEIEHCIGYKGIENKRWGISKGQSEAVNRRTEKEQWPKEQGQTMRSYKPLHREVKIE